MQPRQLCQMERLGIKVAKKMGCEPDRLRSKLATLFSQVCTVPTVRESSGGHKSTEGCRPLGEYLCSQCGQTFGVLLLAGALLDGPEGELDAIVGAITPAATPLPREWPPAG